jgi:endonuclease/exonuclease/phosphatase (EEP) superfamily protein YafD
MKSSANPLHRLPDPLPPRLAQAALLGLAYLYFAALAAWLVAYLVFGDRWSLLFAVNSFAVYLFLPLPIAAVVGLAARHKPLWLLSALGALLWAAFFGRFFLPRFDTAHAEALAEAPALRVMTTNVLGFNTQVEGLVAALRASQADLIAIQELSPLHAAALQRDLLSEYPYQVLDPREGVSGSGVISRYPLAPTGETLPGPWLGTPHVLRVNVPGGPVTLIRFHAHSGIYRVAQREQAAEVLAAYALSHPGPLLVAGDLNATGLSTAHRILTRRLRDAWEERGHGLGHTFPGAASPGSSRPRVLGFLVPKWLIRIDYVFYSDHFTAQSALLGPWDGTSDHRPVVANLVLNQ